ncbi:MAG: glycerophosphodiester phosphodiesterase [Tatlockia sp.]|nr:glycerophosphodiester phosphodiesterase [Tatlockia sp.]
MFLNVAEKILDGFFACLPRKIPSETNANEACLIAHRGAHDHQSGIVENTDAAFSRALALGAFGIELDIHATADGVLVVNHDPCLNRLWGKNLFINELNFKTLRQLVPEIPSLREVVERYGRRMHLFIELKAPFHSEETLKEELNSLVPGQDYHLLSLDASLFSSLSSFPTSSMLLIPIHNNVSQFCKLAMEKNYGGILGHYFLMNNLKIKKLQLAQKLVGVGMVDSRSGLYRELNRGMYWVFSDNLSLLTNCLDELKRDGNTAKSSE